MKVNGGPRSFGTARFSLTMTLKIYSHCSWSSEERVNTRLVLVILCVVLFNISLVCVIIILFQWLWCIPVIGVYHFVLKRLSFNRIYEFIRANVAKWNMFMLGLAQQRTERVGSFKQTQLITYQLMNRVLSVLTSQDSQDRGLWRRKKLNSRALCVPFGNFKFTFP